MYSTRQMFQAEPSYSGLKDRARGRQYKPKMLMFLRYDKRMISLARVLKLVIWLMAVGILLSACTNQRSANAIVAKDDLLPAINGLFGGSSLTSVFENDLLAGKPLEQNSYTATLLNPSPLPNVSLSLSTGIVSVDKETLNGSYPIQYKICKTVDSSSCSSATASVLVNRVAGREFGFSMGDRLRWLAFPTPPGDFTKLDQTLKDIRALGATWIRMDLNWNIVQPTDKTTFDWGKNTQNIDRVIQRARFFGLKVLPILGYSPAWASNSSCTNVPYCEPENIDDFVNFAKAAISRYAGLGVHEWEIWNEPNRSSYWGPSPNPSLYNEMVRKVSLEAKKIDPQASIIAGAFSPAKTVPDSKISPTDFLTQMFADSAVGFDAVSYHAYSYPRLASDPSDSNQWNQLEGSDPSLYSVLLANQFGDQKIWITEFGAPTDGDPDAILEGSSNLKTFVSEDQQAKILKDGIEEFTNSTNLGVFFWYTYSDFPESGKVAKTAEDFFGLIRADGSHKPAYDVFKKAVAGN